MADITTPREVIFYYVEGSSREPFAEWLDSLRDSRGRRHILMRLQKLKQGVYGDRKLLGEGISELRIFFGPGYRVYFGEDGNKIVILMGGDKDSQNNDIQRAKDYWQTYKKRNKL